MIINLSTLKYFESGYMIKESKDNKSQIDFVLSAECQDMNENKTAFTAKMTFEIVVYDGKDIADILETRSDRFELGMRAILSSQILNNKGVVDIDTTYKISHSEPYVKALMECLNKVDDCSLSATNMEWSLVH